jgi:hypothetical protein
MELFCVFFDLNESLYFWCQGSLLITVVGGKQVVQGVPHICFLSGLTGEEILMFVRAFPQSGVKDTVFASHVPNNSNKLIEELIEEIMGDHERLTKGRERAEA